MPSQRSADVQVTGRRPAGLQNGLPSAVYCRCGAENGRRTDIGGCIKSGGYRECEKMLNKDKRGRAVKLANCCMLFGLDKRDAFPVDVWIKRIMEQLYFSGKETDKEKIAAFAKTRFGSYGGYAQQYLFFYGKTVRIARKIKKLKKYNLIIKNKRYFQLSVDKQKAE